MSDVVDLKAFVPAKDLELAMKFYVELGFTVRFANPEIAELDVGGFRFLLQKFYVKAHAGNFMMQLAVRDLDAWWKRVESLGLAERYPDIMIKPPAMQPWGLRVAFLSDPTGVLWHVAEARR